MKANRIGRIVFLLSLFAAVGVSVEAQSISERLKARAKQRIEQQADAAIEKALDEIEGAVKCVADDDDCASAAANEGKKVVVTDKQGVILPPEKQPEGSPAKNADAAAKANAKAGVSAGSESGSAGSTEVGSPGQGAWANFDFVPGERVLFADDFSRDRVGNFPQRLELIQGNLQIVESKGKRWLESTSLHGEIAVPLPEVLPQRFTIEFDFTFPGNFPLAVYSAAQPVAEEFGSGAVTSYIYLAPTNSGLHSGGRDLVDVSPRVGDTEGELLGGVQARARIHVDGKYVKVYVNERRIVNAPNGDLVRGKKIFIRMPSTGDIPVLIADLSINAGGRDMYDALLADGRVVTQGILFDVGSDRIRGESTPTLKIIGDMLKEHADLKLTVEGHTDNTGNAASNLTLSEKRALAIVAYLKSNYGIDGSRLAGKGYGASKPVKGNDTPEGRQQNRRVELVKI